MKCLTGMTKLGYNYRKSKYLISQIPTFLSTNSCFLRFQELASRLARLLLVVWLSSPTWSLSPHKIRLNKPSRQAVDYARVLPLRLHPPEDRGYRKSVASYLYNLCVCKANIFINICLLFLMLREVLWSYNVIAFTVLNLISKYSFSSKLLISKSKNKLRFDQKGQLTGKFGITHVPAIVNQEDNLMRINEVVL